MIEEKQAAKDKTNFDDSNFVRKRHQRISYHDPVDLARENNRLKQKLEQLQGGNK